MSANIGSRGAVAYVRRPACMSGQDPTVLTASDRVLLLLPMAAGIVFGLVPLVVAGPLAYVAGYAGHDQFFYWLTGAAMLGYGVALAVGIREKRWPGVRFVLVAELVFQLVMVYACVREIGGGGARRIISVLAVTAIARIAVAGWLLYRHRAVPMKRPDLAGGRAAVVVMGIAVFAATLFGVLGAFFPVATTHFFGYQGSELFLYRAAGAATLGYAVMGVFNLWSRNWTEIRLPVLMAIVFNGVSFFAAIAAIAHGDPLLMPVTVAIATFVVTVPMIYGFLTIHTAAGSVEDVDGAGDDQGDQHERYR